MLMFHYVNIIVLDVCQNGQIRLAGGNNPREGRVEVCYYNQWGTVCDDAFGFFEAKVICKQLGFANTSKKIQQF